MNKNRFCICKRFPDVFLVILSSVIYTDRRLPHVESHVASNLQTQVSSIIYDIIILHTKCNYTRIPDEILVYN